MDKSPLRKLAEAYAREKLSLEDYREQRRRLLDALEDGDIELPKTSPDALPVPSEDEATRPSRIIPSALTITGALLLALLTWIWLPGTVSETAPGKIATPAAAPVDTSPAQRLLERFLSANQWDNAALASFEAHWRELPENNQLWVRTKPVFQHMENALNRELNAQKALTALAVPTANQVSISQLIAFGVMLGVDGLEPAFSVPEEMPLEATESPSALSPKNRVAGEIADLNGARWLDTQADERFSLQLFAVNHLRTVESLIARFPELELKLVPLERANPRYRLLYGVFPSHDAAWAAYNTLPAAIRSQQPQPVVKTVQELKTGLGKL